MKKSLLLLAATLLLSVLSATPLMADGNPMCSPAGCGNLDSSLSQ